MIELICIEARSSCVCGVSLRVLHLFLTVQNYTFKVNWRFKSPDPGCGFNTNDNQPQVDIVVGPEAALHQSNFSDSGIAP